MPWAELRSSMPKAIWRELRNQSPAIPTWSESKRCLAAGDLTADPVEFPIVQQDQPQQQQQATITQYSGLASEALTELAWLPEVSELCGRKAARRFQRDAAAFFNAELKERSLRVADLEERFAAAVASKSWDQLCCLI
ncbi:unnamed protein product, partial [Polarella glacialis]